MPRPNWFFGFPLDGAFVLELPELPPLFRRFQPEDVHMTLAFLGGVGEEAALRALSALDTRLGHEPIAPLAIALGEVAPMGGSKRDYTALSALLSDGRDEAVRIIGAYRDTLTEAANNRREKRPPKPHITLARPRARADREAGLAWAAGLQLTHVHATLDRIALYTWHENRRERMFKIHAERALGK